MENTTIIVLPPSSVMEEVYNLVSTITNLLTLLISLCLLLFLVYQFIHFNSVQRKKILKNIPILLSINILLLLILRSILQFIDIDLNTIKRNYFSIDQFNDSFICRLRGYLLLSIHTTLYWSYALQAIFRFIRVIFPQYIWLYQSNTFIYIFIPIEFILGFLSMLPLFIGFNAIYLLPNEPYCTASYNELVSLLYMPVVAFFLPLTTISICYICIVRKTRRQSTILHSTQQRNRRDYILIHRIIIIIMILSMVSIPLIIDLCIYLPKGHVDPYMNSIGWVSSSVNAVILALSLPFINPKMYELFKRTNTVNAEAILNQ